MEVHRALGAASTSDAMVSTLLAVEPDPDMAAYLSCLDGPKFLFVGGLLPRDRPDWLLASYHVLATYLEPRAHLLLAGSDRHPSYRGALDSYVAELHLRRAHLIGEVGLRSLVACYRAADVFVTASEHDGPEAPLWEAMAFDAPVLARAFAATPETLGGAGLLLGPDDGPLIAAEAMAVLAKDEKVRASLVDSGRRRLRQLDADSARAVLLGHLESIGS